MAHVFMPRIFEPGIGGNLISFVVDDTTYRAEKGMTWGEWVDSDYNSTGFTLMANGAGTEYFVMDPKDAYVCTQSGDFVYSTDVIQSGVYDVA